MAAERNGKMPNYPKNRFAAFVDDDDDDEYDDRGGGVMLRDFEDDSPSGSASTPIGPKSSTSSGPTCSTVPRKTATRVSFTNATTSGRRNTIEPIGSGRYSENILSPNRGAALNAAVNTWINAKPVEDEIEKKSESVDQVNNFTASVSQIQAGMKAMTFDGEKDKAQSNIYAQMSPAQNTQFGYTQGLNAAMNMATTTPTAHGGATQYPQASNAMEYPWHTTSMGYNSTGMEYTTPQTSGYGPSSGSGLGANFPYPSSDTTPSHMPKNAGKYQMGTPQSASVYNQYNQTEPRNFAPRAGTMTTPMPPPAFNIGRQPAPKTYEESRLKAPDADPFLSPPPKGASIHGGSQALVLASVPEDNRLALTVRQSYHCPVPTEVRMIRSTQLNQLTDGPMSLPTQDVALDSQNFPFIESTTQAAPVGHGVVKIKNIPFGAKRSEIIAFLGRNSKILNDNQEPVHIIMERVSSKTQDCYVEFMTTQDAVRAVDRHRDNLQRGRPSRLGERPVEVLLSSQAAIMQDLFPLASGVWWDNGKPVIQAPIDGQPWKTFKGFVTEEEMTMLVKHVEIPQRSPYSKECPQRAYECMVSTIKKLPWYVADRITLRQRHAIYEATMKLIALLKQALAREHRSHETVINSQLMKRLVTAGMLCPGFSVVQKDNIAALAEMDQERARMFNQPRFAEQWVHMHGVCPKPGTPIDVLEWYIAIIREETTRYIHNKQLVERNEIQRTSCYTSLYFGYAWYEIGLPTGKDLDNITLHAVARRELAVIERILRRAFPAVAHNGKEMLLN